MFGSRLFLIGAVLLALPLVALGAARPSSGAAPANRSAGPVAGEAAYVVVPGDTLWDIALARYEGDPREAVWLIERRNGLDSAAIQPGEVLVLP